MPYKSKVYHGVSPEFSGYGWVGGSLPPDPNPNSPDGRTRINGEPVTLEVRLADSRTRRLQARQRSKADGTWRFSGLNPSIPYAIEFVNQNGVHVDNNGAPYNSFVQDFIYPVADYCDLGAIWNHSGTLLSVDVNTIQRTFDTFRIVVYDSFDDGVSSAAEIVLKNSNGDAFTPTIIQASSTYNASHLAEFAFDGDISTWWASQGGSEPKWIMFKAPGEPFESASLDITCSPDSTWGPLQAFKSFDLQSSRDDGMTWQVVLAVRDLSEWSPSEQRTFSIPFSDSELAYAPYLVHGSISLTNSNKTATGIASNGGHVKGELPKTDGKWYIEVNIDEINSGSCSPVGLVHTSRGSASWLGEHSNSIGLYTGGDGVWTYWYDGLSQTPWSGHNGTVAMMAWDGDTGRIWYGVNGVWFDGDPGSNTNPVIENATFASDTFHFASCPRNTGSQVTINQTPQYAVPQGFSYWS